MAALAAYEWSPSLSYAIQWLHSPVDGSGVVVPSSTITASDAVSIVFSAYVPYGAEPAGGLLQSDFGASPPSALVQFRIYR